MLENQQFKKIFQTKNKNITSVAINENDNIFIGSDRELIQIDIKGNIKSVTSFADYIHNIWIKDEANLWVETKRLENESQAITLWEKSINSKSATKFYSFDRAVIETNISSATTYPIQDNFLIIKNDAAFLINHQAEQIKDLNPYFNKNYHISPFNIATFQNMLWIGSSSGTLKVTQQPEKFKLIHKNPDGLSATRGITEDENGNIYFNLAKGYKYNPKSNEVETFREFPGTSVLHYYENIIFTGLFSIKSLGGVSDLSTKKFQELGKKDVLISSIAKTSQKNEFLLGTRKGIFFINLKTFNNRPFTQYNEFDVLKTVLINSIQYQAEKIWLATSQGIFLMTEKDGVIRHFSQLSKDLPFDYIQHLHIDEKGVLWLASRGGGLIRWQPSFDENKPSEFKQFTINDGLSHNFLYAVYEDENQNLWIPSDNGIMKFDKETKQIQTFTTNDGLLHNEFNKMSHYKAKDGTFYLVV